MRRTFDTAALAAAFPFTSPDLPPADPTSVAAPDGVLYGYNLGSPGLVHWDRFALRTTTTRHPRPLRRRQVLPGQARTAPLAVPGHRGRRSSTPKTNTPASPHAVGGHATSAAATGRAAQPVRPARPHPHPDGRRTAPPDALIRRSLFLHTVLGVLLGELAPTEPGRARPRHHRHLPPGRDHRGPAHLDAPGPPCADLRDLLAAPASRDTAANGGSARRAATPVRRRRLLRPVRRPDHHPPGRPPRRLLPARPARRTQTGRHPADPRRIWRRVSDPADRRPRLVIVDEAWLLMSQPAGAEFLFRMAKAARKHWAGLTVATQDTADVLATDLGQAVVANAATQILLAPSPASHRPTSPARSTSPTANGNSCSSAERGQGLLSSGTAPGRLPGHRLRHRGPIGHQPPAQLASTLADQTAEGLDDRLDLDVAAPRGDGESRPG